MSTLNDNSTCSVLFVGGTSSLYVNPVILVQGGIHEIALLLLFRNSPPSSSLVVTNCIRVSHPLHPLHSALHSHLHHPCIRIAVFHFFGILPFRACCDVGSTLKGVISTKLPSKFGG